MRHENHQEHRRSIMDTPPLFLIGAQRSGTTLLRLLLNAHSQIAIPEEGSFLMPLLKRKYLKKKIAGAPLKRLVSYLMLNDQFRLWGYDYSAYLSMVEYCFLSGIKVIVFFTLKTVPFIKE